MNKVKIKSTKLSKIDFCDRVYAVVSCIPSGRVTSYGAIGNYLGMRSSARMVGWVLSNAHKQHKTVGIPAHRVVNRNGLLTGKHHFETPETMSMLLQREGISINDDHVVDFKKLFWDPTLIR
ncbi:MAG: MGMT family protein [Phycisphaerales bacterium]|nr:MGMT family protein [Phycisphaerales bacterium]